MRSFWGSASFILASLVLVVCGAFVLRAAHAPEAHYAWLLVALALLAASGRATTRQPGAGSEHAPRSEASEAVRDSARSAIGGALAASFALYAPHLAQAQVVMAAGGLTATVAGLTCLRKTTGLVGVLGRASPPAQGAVGMLALSWLFALALALVRLLPEAEQPSLATPLVLSTVLAAVGMASLTVLIASALMIQSRRALELGASERFSSFSWLAATLLVLSVAQSALGLVSAETSLPIAAAMAGAVAGLSSITRDPRTLTARATLLFAFSVLVAPAVVAAAFLVRQWPHRALEVSALSAAAAGVLALASRPLAARLSGYAAPWSANFARAARTASLPDPDDALVRTLGTLRELAQGTNASPLLVRRDPPLLMRVDRAGYPQSEKGEAPEAAYDVAQQEPLAVALLPVLHRAAVRHPGARTTHAWMESRDLLACALLRDEDLPTGLLCLPRLGRSEPLSLEEVVLLSELANELGASMAASSRIARALSREDELRQETRLLGQRAEDLSEELGRERDRGEALTRALAERVRVACYAPASRLAVEAVERLAQEGALLTLLAPPGVDALGFAAVYHLASKRCGAGLRLAHGSSPELADLALWHDEKRGPLSRARDGTLVIIDPDQLPEEVQRYVASSLDERVSLVTVVARTIDVLAATGQLVVELADRLGARIVGIPELSMRSEDLRALVLHHLARLGSRHRSGPMGIAPSALALLVEHAFVANDLELETMLTRAVLSAEGEVVTKGDLQNTGLLG